MRILLICLALFFSSAVSAATAPDIVVIHILDDVHPSSITDFTSTHPESHMDFPVTTPKLDALAAAGVKMISVYVQNVCSPTRSELLGLGPVGSVRNHFGQIQSMEIPPTHAIKINTSQFELFNQYKDAGYTIIYGGKMHIGQDQLGNNFSAVPWAIQAGVDELIAHTPGNPTKSAGCLSLREFNLDQSNSPNDGWGHRYWCQYNQDGSFEIIGNGVDPDFYTNKVLGDAMGTRISLAITNSEKALFIIGWPAPHAPWLDGTADGGNNDDLDYNDDGTPDGIFQLDVPPGGVGSTKQEIYIEMLEDLDTRIGTINDLLDLAAGNDNHLVVVIGDNGVPNKVAGTDCLAAIGQKGSPYPCGTNVPVIWDGDAIIGVNSEMPGLFDANDISATLIALINRTTRVSGNYEFSDCLTHENGRDEDLSAGTCPDRPVVTTHEWQPIGGNTGLNPFPPLDGDAAVEWTDDDWGVYTKRCGGKTFFLQRNYDTQQDPIAPEKYCENFYEVTVSNPYVASGSPPASRIATTTCPADGPVATGSFDADQLCAYALLDREIDFKHLHGDPIQSY